MKRLWTLALSVFVGCAADGGYHSDLRATVDRADHSLAEMVLLAEASVQHSAGVNARIDKTADQFAIGAIANEERHDLRLDFHGAVITTQLAGPAGGGCQTQITLAEALEIAEAEADGDAVAVVPDDDDPCMREIQVLVGTTLWEVKVGPSGAIVETELSDEEL